MDYGFEVYVNIPWRRSFSRNYPAAPNFYNSSENTKTTINGQLFRIVSTLEIATWGFKVRFCLIVMNACL